MNLPIRTRLTIWYVALLAAILAALSAFLLLRLRTDLVSGLDRSLDSRAAQISLGYTGDGGGEFQDITDATLGRSSQGEHGAQILSWKGVVIQSSGDQVAETPILDRTIISRVLGGQHVHTGARLGSDREPFRLLALPVPGRPTREILVVATSLEEINASIHRLLVLLIAAVPAVLLAAALVGWWLARKALLPVARMTEQASGIGIDQLDERIAVPRVDDELGRLARTLNGMLDRLERGVDEKRRFVADASHELRTPIAVMRSELEVSLRSRHIPPEARGVLESAVEEVDRMARTVENLLTLARLDEGKLQLVRAPLDLRDMAEAVASELQPLAATNGISVTVEGDPAATVGDRDRLRQVVTNLVDNAIKYSSRGGEVRVSVWSAGNDVGITVSDSGPGIPSAALPRLFDRFFRQDSARTRSSSGAGLGLAICRQIVEAHRGRIWVESEVGMGSAFSLALPRSTSNRLATDPALSGAR